MLAPNSLVFEDKELTMFSFTQLEQLSLKVLRSRAWAIRDQVGADTAAGEPLVLGGVEQRREVRLDAVGHHLSAAEHPVERTRVRAQTLLLQEASGEAGAAE